MKKILFFIVIGLLFIGGVNARINDYIDNAGTIDYDAVIESGAANMKTRKPNSVKEFQAFMMYSGFTGYEAMTAKNCNEDYTECEINVREEGFIKVELNYPELDPEVSKRITEYEKSYSKLPTMYGNESVKKFSISDLDVLNFYYFSFNNSIEDSLTDESGSQNYDKVINSSIKFMTDFKKTYGNSNIVPKYYTNGFNILFDGFDNSDTFGDLFLLYGDIVYGYINIDLEYLNIIYVPSDTTNSEEAMLAAAKKRLKDYFGKDFEFSVSREVTADNDGMWATEVADPTMSYFGDTDKMSHNIYYVTINGINYEFLIIRDSSKMVDENVYTVDLKSDVSVEINNKLIPKDTSVEVEVVNNNDDYKKVLNKEENVYTFDISLYSDVVSDYITKTDDKFIVKIPVPTALEGKELVVEYIKTDKTIEEHLVVVKDGYAEFETNHFSVYSLSEKKTEEIVEETTTEEESISPKTGDNVLLYIVALLLSVFGMIKVNRELKKI